MDEVEFTLEDVKAAAEEVMRLDKQLQRALKTYEFARLHAGVSVDINAREFVASMKNDPEAKRMRRDLIPVKISEAKAGAFSTGTLFRGLDGYPDLLLYVKSDTDFLKLIQHANENTAPEKDIIKFTVTEEWEHKMIPKDSPVQTFSPFIWAKFTNSNSMTEYYQCEYGKSDKDLESLVGIYMDYLYKTKQ